MESATWCVTNSVGQVIANAASTAIVASTSQPRGLLGTNLAAPLGTAATDARMRRKGDRRRCAMNPSVCATGVAGVIPE
ncbi:hypothetical protein GCM10027273_21250 [Nocardioides pakistanensis]